MVQKWQFNSGHYWKPFFCLIVMENYRQEFEMQEYFK